MLKSLHWLLVNFRYQFKILTRTVMALRGEAPTYIVKLLHANSPNWILRYTDSGLLGILHLSENHRGLCLPNLSAKAMDLSLSLSLSDTDTNIWSNMIAIFKSPILSIFVFFETSKQRSCRVPPGGKKIFKDSNPNRVEGCFTPLFS